MSISRHSVWISSVSVLLLNPGAVWSQNYPNRPVRILSTEPGGSADSAARILAQGLAGPLGQQVVVDSRPAIIAIETTAKAPPDGYSVVLISNLLWILPLMRNTTYDAARDFLPVSLVASSPNILTVHSSLPVRSVKDLITLAKSKPGQLNYGAGQAGSSNHLAAELFIAMTGLSIVRVNYKGGGPLVTALVGGEVPLAFASAAAVTNHLKSGRLKALGVTSARTSALLPGLPPIAATVPGYESVAAYGMFAPIGTPSAIISRLNQEIVRFLNTPEAREKYLSTGAETVGNTPEQFANMISSETVRMGKVIKDAGIRVD